MLVSRIPLLAPCFYSSLRPSPPVPRFLPLHHTRKKRMNARDASNLEGVGDLTAAGVRLGNRTFNSLKRDIRKKKEKGMSSGGRVEGATRSTQEGVMVRLIMYKLEFFRLFLHRCIYGVRNSVIYHREGGESVACFIARRHDRSLRRSPIRVKARLMFESHRVWYAAELAISPGFALVWEARQRCPVHAFSRTVSGTDHLSSCCWWVSRTWWLENLLVSCLVC